MNRILAILAAGPFAVAALLWLVSQARPSGFSLADPPPKTARIVWTPAFLSYDEYPDQSQVPAGSHLNLWFLTSGRRTIITDIRPGGDTWNVTARYCRYTVLFFQPLLAVTAPGLAPLVWMLAVRLWRRLGPTEGVCPRCGYDLRATPARCPECGTVATASAAAAR